MPTTYTSRDRLALQLTGEDQDIWGDVVNSVFQRLEDSKDGVLTLVLNGNRTLVSANDTTDEAHYGVLYIASGSGGTITVPNVQKNYTVAVNPAVTGDVTITAGGAASVVSPGEVVQVYFTGADCFRGTMLRNQSDPSKPGDVATKRYVDAQAFAGQSGNLPGQNGSAGKYLQTNGSTASWQIVDTTTAQSLALVFSLIF